MKFLSFIVCLLILLSCQQQTTTKQQINTVNGTIKGSELGLSLTHEHIMSNFGKTLEEAADYDTIALFEQVIPYLKRLKALGVNSIIDCTTAYFGRRVDLLKYMAEVAEIQLITNTGIYGAARDRYIPAFAYKMSIDSIAQIWINEFENGIKGTDIKPGFVKLAFDDGESPSAIDAKLFKAGLLTHLSTGLTLAVHTGKNLEAVKLQTKLLEEYQVHPSAWIWTHANKVEVDAPLIELATKGAWISLDGVKTSNIDTYIRRLQLFKQKNLLNRVLLSHDGNGFPAGGSIRPFEAIFTDLLPAMRKAGFTEEDIKQLLVNNPKEAFSIQVRRI